MKTEKSSLRRSVLWFRFQLRFRLGWMWYKGISTVRLQKTFLEDRDLLNCLFYAVTSVISRKFFKINMSKEFPQTKDGSFVCPLRRTKEPSLCLLPLSEDTSPHKGFPQFEQKDEPLISLCPQLTQYTAVSPSTFCWSPDSPTVKLCCLDWLCIRSRNSSTSCVFNSFWITICLPSLSSVIISFL